MRLSSDFTKIEERILAIIWTLLNIHLAIASDPNCVDNALNRDLQDLRTLRPTEVLQPTTGLAPEAIIPMTDEELGRAYTETLPPPPPDQSSPQNRPTLPGGTHPQVTLGSEALERAIGRRLMGEMYNDILYDHLPDGVNGDYVNQRILNGLRAMPLPRTSRIASLDQSAASELMNTVRRLYAPFVAPIVGRNYDPQEAMGFCFGRAMVFHLHALRSGIDRQSVRKIWAIGRVVNNQGTLGNGRGGTWQYHVATMIRSQDGGWWVFDPAQFSEPVSVEYWVNHMRQNSASSVPEIITTPAERGNTTWGGYQSMDLSHPILNNYFTDLLRLMKAEARYRNQLRRNRESSDPNPREPGSRITSPGF